MCVNTADSADGELRARYGDRIVSFENEDPTTEVLARVIFQTFTKKLADYAARNDGVYLLGKNVRMVSVKVWETISCSAHPPLAERSPYWIASLGPQSARDSRGIAIDQVGITELCYPISVMSKEGQLIPTVASITMSVRLPKHLRGTHRSRFLEVLVKHRGEITPQSLTEIVRDLKERQNVESACFEVAFPHFIERTAPVTGARRGWHVKVASWPPRTKPARRCGRGSSFP